MKKGDKIVVVLGVVILILASIGIYYWTSEETAKGIPSAKELSQISGVFSKEVDSITVSDSDPFYPLIATPLAVHYDSDGNQYVAPLYVTNITEPSSAVTDIKEIMGLTLNELIIDSGSPKEISLDIAKNNWESSKAVILIKNDKEGYCLGVLATPLASYLGAPVIVTDKTDSDVINVLKDLGVEYSFVCGDIEGYGNTYKFNSADDVVNLSIDIVKEKFGQVDYITLTNPVDAWPPTVLDSKSFTFGPITLPSGASTNYKQSTKSGGMVPMGKFKIPDDYKYALIKWEGINLDSDDVDQLGDWAVFSAGADLPDIPKGLQGCEGFGGSSSTQQGGIAVRDANGNLITDKVNGESVLYGRGGVTYTVKCKGQWMAKSQGRAMVNVVVEKLENPVYPMMKNLSCVAPYLTAYHKGVVYGKPEFAFTADDTVLTDEGTTAPGFYLPRRNARIVDKSNKHIFDVIHKPLNDILAKIADIKLVDDRDIGILRDHYDQYPVYIALVGDATVLPNYIYQNYMEPVDYMHGTYAWGVGTPSDVIYGDIDPTLYDWSNQASDIFTKYPCQENIVGRITGWDVQDASALIVKSVLYSDIIEKLGDWKNTFAVLVGEGQDFQQPVIRFPIAKALGAAHPGEPMKLWTGYGEIMLEKMVKDAGKTWGFKTVYQAYKEAANLQGFSDAALNKLKYETTPYNKIFFFKSTVKKLIGESAVVGGKMMEGSNFVFMNAHGNMGIVAMDGINTVASGFGGPIAQFIIKKILEVISPWGGTGASLAAHGQYSTREVDKMKLGPSFIWLESCICGKIDGMYPKNVISQTFLHVGAACVIASTCGSNIAGGYLEPKKKQTDTPISVLSSYIKAKMNAKKGIYPDDHFGFLIYSDMLKGITEDNASFGKALRDAKNTYLEKDAGWKLWWSPPLAYASTGDSELDAQIGSTLTDLVNSEALSDPYMMNNKYTSFQEYTLYGDPALNPYDPLNEGS